MTVSGRAGSRSADRAHGRPPERPTGSRSRDRRSRWRRSRHRRVRAPCHRRSGWPVSGRARGAGDRGVMESVPACGNTTGPAESADTPPSPSTAPRPHPGSPCVVGVHQLRYGQLIIRLSAPRWWISSAETWSRTQACGLAAATALNPCPQLAEARAMRPTPPLLEMRSATSKSG